jgi:hypothetical protein
VNAAIGQPEDLTLSGRKSSIPPMKATWIGAIAWVFWAVAMPANAQTATVPQPGEKPARPAPPATLPRSPAPQPPPAEPEKMSHQAMVEEQERRDREAEAERDRDDQT